MCVAAATNIICWQSWLQLSSSSGYHRRCSTVAVAIHGHGHGHRASACCRQVLLLSMFGGLLATHRHLGHCCCHRRVTPCWQQSPCCRCCHRRATLVCPGGHHQCCCWWPWSHRTVLGAIVLLPPPSSLCHTGMSRVVVVDTAAGSSDRLAIAVIAVPMSGMFIGETAAFYICLWAYGHRVHAGVLAASLHGVCRQMCIQKSCNSD